MRKSYSWLLFLLISFIITEDEYFFIWLLAFCISSLVNRLFMSFVFLFFFFLSAEHYLLETYFYLGFHKNHLYWFFLPVLKNLLVKLSMAWPSWESAVNSAILYILGLREDAWISTKVLSQTHLPHFPGTWYLPQFQHLKKNSCLYNRNASEFQKWHLKSTAFWFARIRLLELKVPQILKFSFCLSIIKFLGIRVQGACHEQW